ncbi:hypothetical protein ACFQ3N_02265 [Virgibacillus byunsanensis]|uniref:Uncharacterized protein n=1 Tax=Virgibacillus byunsanensis TaxID=570945 RepID=A0ABW3LIC4_9BACI
MLVKQEQVKVQSGLRDQVAERDEVAKLKKIRANYSETRQNIEQIQIDGKGKEEKGGLLLHCTRGRADKAIGDAKEALEY